MIDIASLFGGGAASARPSAAPAAALAQAERGKARQLAQIAERADVKREVAAFERALAQAKTPADFLSNVPAVRVMLSGDGLADQAQYTGLVRRVLTSDARQEGSAAQQIGASNAAWLNATSRYDMVRRGLAVLKRPDVVAAIKQGFYETRWREQLDQQTPGLGLALDFKARASRLDTAIKILGDPVGREVVTTAFGIPREIARQGLQTQQRALEARFDPARLKRPDVVDAVARRFLLAVNQPTPAQSTGLVAPGLGRVV